ncbi:ABC transporter permease subunit [Allorhizobium sp. BGMRC 0089]|uniref:ABC transporter permease n=1 Tax=Allorhizobium sonneratiae TaxID=2934936 RepID=UPI002033DF0B|nr:ABC transporter permease subunit [Allorhizobium sonneratiae]MCM2291415.1 ABC transporter permease subunit [Allorhizobium sonneratiae]
MATTSPAFTAGKTQTPSRGGLIGLLLVAAPVLIVGWLILYPIIIAILSTLHVEDGDKAAWTVKSYRFFFSDPYSLASLRITLWTTAVCAVLLIITGFPIALYLRFAKTRLAGYVQGLAIFPMFVPSIILGFALIRTIGPNGAVDILLHAAGLPKLPSPYLTPWGPVIGLVWDNIPLTVLMLTSGLARISDASIEAARDVGAGPLRVFVHIILPRMGNSIMVASAFAILGIFSSFTFPYLLGPATPEMMGPLMLRTFNELYDPLAAKTQAVVSFGFCLVFGLFYIYSMAKNREAGKR